MYVIEDPEGLVVVDSGWAMPDSRAALERALATLGHRLDDVAQFLVTHAHWDHYSQALALRESFGTRVRIGRGEQPSIEAFDRRVGLHPGRSSCSAGAARTSSPARSRASRWTGPNATFRTRCRTRGWTTASGSP